MTDRDQKGWNRASVLALIGFILACAYIASCVQDKL